MNTWCEIKVDECSPRAQGRQLENSLPTRLGQSYTLGRVDLRLSSWRSGCVVQPRQLWSEQLLPHSDWKAILKLAYWVCATNPSMLEQKRAWSPQIGEIGETKSVEVPGFRLF